MIGEPTLDPRQGDRRKKALQAYLQQKARQLGSPISRFARTGVGRGAVSGFGRRPVSAGGRPSGILNFLNRGGHAPEGFARGLSQYNGLSGGVGQQLVAPAELPTMSLPSPTAPAAPTGGGTGGSGSVSSAPMQEYTTAPDGSVVPTSPTPGLSDAVGGVDLFTQNGGQSLTLIPLGGGAFLDVATGTIYGGGLTGISSSGTVGAGSYQPGGLQEN